MLCRPILTDILSIYLLPTYLITCQKTRLIFSTLRRLRVKSQNRSAQEELVPSSPPPCEGLLQTHTHPKQQAVGYSLGLGVPTWSVQSVLKGQAQGRGWCRAFVQTSGAADSRRCSRKRGPGSGWAIPPWECRVFTL